MFMLKFRKFAFSVFLGRKKRRGDGVTRGECAEVIFFVSKCLSKHLKVVLSLCENQVCHDHNSLLSQLQRCSNPSLIRSGFLGNRLISFGRITSYIYITSWASNTTL